MITLAHRFHGHNSLRPVYQKGKQVYGPNVKLLWTPAQKQGYRVAVVVSKKVHKSAVVRNRIRRRLYEIVRLYVQAVPINVDLVFIVQTDKLASLPADNVKNEVLELLKKTTSMS
jgi:ribonuclease P protein component